MKCLTANDLAGNDLNDQKSFRKALREAALIWHVSSARWKACTDSQKQDMNRVYQEWQRKKPQRI
jgi:hypothetical protein